MFEPFPDNYTWCLGVNLVLDTGGAIGDVDQACRSLRGRSSPPVEEAWYETWKRLGERLLRQAGEDVTAGRGAGAARKYQRAAAYFAVAERHLPNKDFRKLESYRQMLAAFASYVQQAGDRVEFVEVPYEDTSLPALYLPPNASAPAPAVIYFNGFDSIKEMEYFWGPRELQQAGIGVLLCDQPGSGGALRLHNVTARFDSEVPAGACVDWLERRPELDRDRIGIVAPSLGGYYAPRAAAFEQRLRCCVAWGAQWDYHDLWLRRLKGGSEYPVPPFQLAWVLGVETNEQALRKLQDFTLDGVIQRLECPLLILHGENDRQVPVEHARRSFDAAGSRQKELKIFTLDEGGAEHCQLDNMHLATDYIHTWLVNTLGVQTPSPSK